MVLTAANWEAFGDRAAVIDLGSNSARVVVVQPEVGGHFATIDEERVPLRLGRRLVGGELSPDAIEDCLAAIARFRSIAAGAGTTRIHAVATAAIREARNRETLIQRAWAEHGVSIRVIDGDEEARLAAIGAVLGLPFDHGYVVDIGGGSCELALVEARKVQEAWTFPFGALRATDDYLPSDPSAPQEVDALRGAVESALHSAGVTPMLSGQALAGTGGTIRNVAKLDRRRHAYPVERLHGYPLPAQSIERLAASVASSTLAERLSMSGLNPDRADSIVGGLVVLDAVTRFLRAGSLIVSGQGIREGVLAQVMSGGDLPAADEVRRSSVEALARRFRGWRAERARQRAYLAEQLLPALDPGSGRSFHDIAIHACTLIDIGAFIDFYNRHRHTADIILDSDLLGFSHEQIVLLVAVIRLVEKEGANLSAYLPLLDDDARAIAARLAVIVALADELQRHTPPDGEPEIDLTVSNGILRIASPFIPGPCPPALAERVRKAFRLQVEMRRR